MVDAPLVPTEVVEAASRLRRAANFQAFSPTLPTLTAGAYYAFSRHQFAECIIDSFIVLEQLVDRRWHEYLRGLEESSPSARSRSYPVAKQLRILSSAGAIEERIRDLADQARDHRNRLAHRAEASFDAAEIAMRAMHAGLEWTLGESVDAGSCSRGVNW